MQTVNSGRVYGSSGGSEKLKTNLDGCSFFHTNTKKPTNKKLSEKDCKAKLLKLISMRDYSVESMKTKLKSSGFKDEDIDKTIEFGCKHGFLNDKRYAQNFILSKQELGWGRARIEKSLEDKGVEYLEIDGYPDEFFSDDSEIKRAIKCISSHRTSSKNIRDAHYRYLLSKGYSSSVASRALREYGM